MTRTLLRAEAKKLRCSESIDQHAFVAVGDDDCIWGMGATEKDASDAALSTLRVLRDQRKFRKLTDAEIMEAVTVFALIDAPSMSSKELISEFTAFQERYLIDVHQDLDALVPYVSAVGAALDRKQDISRAVEKALDFEFDLTGKCSFFEVIHEKLRLESEPIVPVFCDLCRSDPQPRNSSPRRCAFSLGGRFQSDNWNCATMNALREIVGYQDRCDDAAGSVGIIRIPGHLDIQGYVVLTWYKDRGRTGGARVVNDSAPDQVLTLELARALLSPIE